MSDLVAQIDAFERAFKTYDPAKREQVLLELADRFSDDWVCDSPLAATVHDEVVLRLCAKASIKVRVALSERLAHLPGGPVQTVTSFAHDALIAVAGPVLRHSPLLNEDDLANLAWIRGADHLQAIAGRHAVSEVVTDALVARNVAPVLTCLAENRTAHLSKASLAALVSIALGNETLSHALLERTDLPNALAARLGGRGAAGEPAYSLTDIGPEYSAAAARVAKVATKRELAETDITALMRQGQWESAVMVIVHLADEPAGIVVPAMNADTYEPTLAAMRVAGLTWSVAEAVLKVRIGRLGRQRSLGELKALYTRLSPTAAARMLREAPAEAA